LIDEKVDHNHDPRNFKVVLIDKEKTQIDAAAERMMTWTEDLEEEVPVKEQAKIEEEEDEEFDPNEEGQAVGEDEEEDNAFQPENSPAL
jgi:hypothetical protein